MIKINDIQKSYSYPLIQLRGCVHRSVRSDQIFVSFDSFTTDWPIIESNFKFLVYLKKAITKVEVWLQNDGNKQTSKLNLSLKFKPMSNKNFLRIVYLICDDSEGSLFENGSFQAPAAEDNSIGSAINRIGFNVLCSQCFFAQTLPNHKTFNLELDENNFPRIHVFKLSATIDQIWTMGSSLLWQFVAKQLISSVLADDSSKYIAFSSFTRYSRQSPQKNSVNSSQLTQDVKGYSALGGGRLALFGTACLYTWATDLQDIKYRFNDKRLVERNHFMDDSNNRGYLWSCYSTTLGAMIHELAHVFDIGHSDSGIMAFDFHHIRSFFILESSLSKERKWWTPSQTCILRHHKWFNTINICQNESSFTISDNTIKSKFGIICIEYRNSNNEMTFKSQVFTLGVKCVHLDRLKDAIVFAIDSKGNSIKLNLNTN